MNWAAIAGSIVGSLVGAGLGAGILILVYKAVWRYQDRKAARKKTVP